MKAILILCLVLGSLPAPGACVPAAAGSNIMFIVGDALGYADVGIHGSKEIPTPNLAALAESGVRLRWPRRGAILTVYYAQQKVKVLEQAWQRQTDSFTELAHKNVSK